MREPSRKTYISIVLAEKIIELLETSGASEVEMLSALDVARSIVPLTGGSNYSKAIETSEKQTPPSA